LEDSRETVQQIMRQKSDSTRASDDRRSHHHPRLGPAAPQTLDPETNERYLVPRAVLDGAIVVQYLTHLQLELLGREWLREERKATVRIGERRTSVQVP